MSQQETNRKMDDIFEKRSKQWKEELAEFHKKTGGDAVDFLTRKQIRSDVAWEEILTAQAKMLDTLWRHVATLTQEFNQLKEVVNGKK